MLEQTKEYKIGRKYKEEEDMKQDQELFSHGLNVMTNFSGTCMLTELNVTADSYNPGSVFVWPMLQYFLCILGLVGNGNVIWLLAFHIKRNTFTTYVLNLALADSGVLIILLVIGIVDVSNHFVWHGFPFLDVQILYYLFGLMHGVGQFLLTTISIDRSVNPLIYFLVGRNRRSPSTESMKFILQRVFKEQENSEGDLEPRVQIQL
ncbi:Mas-related G-protein coupled receptor member H [Varanus komodoensis]|nr:Mas-related G-protein coupled receptor member H [Varanus komodoensis]